MREKLFALMPDRATRAHATRAIERHVWAIGRRRLTIKKLGGEIHPSLCLIGEYTEEIHEHRRAVKAIKEEFETRVQSNRRVSMEP